MMGITELAPAKLNLTLDVGARRPDGYHDITSIMQSAALYDVVALDFSEAGGIAIECPGTDLPTGPDNLAWKAADVFFRETNIPRAGISIRLEKKIPSQAGLGGGSSDAAAVLRGMRRLFHADVSDKSLEAMAARVGSDVPYCIRGVTALAQGRGEVLTPLSPLPHCWVVACKTDFPVSTPELFARIDSCRIRRRPDADGLMAALDQGDLMEVARRMYNVFEDVLPERQFARVADIKNTLIQQGALGANMSGTGPTAFGLFASQTQAQAAYDALKQRYQEVFLAETV